MPVESPAKVDPECVDMRVVAAMLGLGYTSFRNMRARGEGPRPTFTVGRSPRWSIASVRSWIVERDARKGKA